MKSPSPTRFSRPSSMPISRPMPSRRDFGVIRNSSPLPSPASRGGRISGRMRDSRDVKEKREDYELAVRAAKLWPNRKHEASAVLGLLCRVGLHRWRRLDLRTLAPNRDIAHCFWCSKVKIDGSVFDI